MARPVTPRKGVSRPRSRNWRERLQDHREVARSSGLRLLQAPIANMLTILVIASALLLPALLFSVNRDLGQVLNSFQSSARLNLYLALDVTPEQASEVSDNLLDMTEVAGVVYIPPDQALAEFAASSGLESLVQELPVNPLPGTLVVTPVDTGAEAVALLASTLQTLPAVQEIQVDNLWLQRLEALSNLVSLLGRALAVIMLLGLLIIVGNTIRLGIESRRSEIQVIKLVGGTNAYIARPFLYTGIWLGSLGGLLAWVLVWVVLDRLNGALATLMQLYNTDFALQGPGFAGLLIIVLAGGLIGWGSALLASFRHILAIHP